MTHSRAWTAYKATYRANEVGKISQWIAAGDSGCLVGLPGSGKSNLLGFLCHRPEVLKSYWPGDEHNIALVQVDLNNLPGSEDLSIFYRVILRSLFEDQAQLTTLAPALGNVVEMLYRKVEDKTDPFLSQSALREILFLFQEKCIRLVLVLDPFDSFCRNADTPMLDNLRSLRDSFKTTLSYLIGVRYELALLRDPEEIGEIYELFDTRVCWVGAMVEADARWVIDQVAQTTGQAFTEKEIEAVVALGGYYPALLKTISMWLVETDPRPDVNDWPALLLAERSIRRRLQELWDALSQPEQSLLIDLKNRPASSSPPKRPSKKRDDEQKDMLIKKGLCRRVENSWQIRSGLVDAFVATEADKARAKIWRNEKTGLLYQNQTPLNDLTPLERSILEYLVEHPYTRHPKTDLIINTWPDELRRRGVSDQSLYQVILELRKKIEPVWTKPRYLTTWRGKPEGGYQFFPEGRPR